jgi:hypothetical protein
MSAIHRKSDALKKYNNGTIENIMMFCEDKDNSGSKRFYVTNPKVIFDKITCNDVSSSHFYESWSDSSNIMFSLDMDIKNKTYNEARSIMISNIYKIYKAAKKYYEYEYTARDIIVLESEPNISIKESNN